MRANIINGEKRRSFSKKFKEETAHLIMGGGSNKRSKAK